MVTVTPRCCRGGTGDSGPVSPPGSSRARPRSRNEHGSVEDLLVNAADHPVRVRRYPSDRTDAEWAVVRAALPVLACLEGRGGRPEGYCHWEMLDAVFHLVDNGIKWRAMPADSPAWGQVYAFFRRWRDGALVTELHHRLRGRVREPVGPNGRSRGSPSRSPSQR